MCLSRMVICDTGGRCRHIPALSRDRRFDPRANRDHLPPCQEADGYVWSHLPDPQRLDGRCLNSALHSTPSTPYRMVHISLVLIVPIDDVHRRPAWIPHTALSSINSSLVANSASMHDKATATLPQRISMVPARPSKIAVTLPAAQ